MINFGAQQLVFLLEINWEIFHLLHITMSGKAREVEDLDLNVDHFCKDILGHSTLQLVQKNKRAKYQDQMSTVISLVDFKPEEAQVLRSCLVKSLFHYIFCRRGEEESQGVRECGKATL